MSKNVLQFAADALEAKQAVALLTVTKTTGSSPASPGQMMAVLADGSSSGTVGGGLSEYRLKLRAQQALENNEAAFSFAYDHSELGMICGGGMEGFGHTVGTGTRLILFGGGHIAQKLASLARQTGFSVSVVEDRAELASEFDDVQFILAAVEDYPTKVSISKDSYVVICTRGHHTDDAALRFCLQQSSAYLGMIGSALKVKTLLDGLRADGYQEETLARLFAPIGLNIASEVPTEIAVSILAEMLLIKNSGSLEHKKSVS